MHSQTTGRIAWIDELKGFLMLVVIAGHCPLIHYIPYYGVVGQCFMAAFYFLSGYTYRDRGEGFSAYCGKRAKRLLIPYAVWGAALVAQDTVQSLLHGMALKTILLHKWGGLIYCRYMLCAFSYTSGGVHLLTSSNSTVWFLTSMFLTSLLFFALVRLRGKWLALSSLACLAVSGAFTYCPILLPWSLDTVPLTAVIMLSGFYFRKIDWEEMKLWRKGVILAVIAAVYLVSLKAGDGINLSIRIYGARGLVSYAWALPQLFLGSACFALFFAMIPQGNLLAPLASIGRHSVTYLCEHLFALFIAGRVLSLFEVSEFALALLSYLFAVAMVALTCFIFDRLKGRIALLCYL